MKCRVEPSRCGWARCEEGVTERQHSLTEAWEHWALSGELYQTCYRHAARAMIRNGAVLCQDMGLSSFSHSGLCPGVWNVTWQQQHCVPTVPGKMVLEAPKCTCAALGASAENKGQYQTFNISDTVRCVISLHRWHTVMDTNEWVRRLCNDSLNNCSGTELGGKGSFNWSWWDPFVSNGSYYTLGSQKLRLGCWIPPWRGQTGVFELREKLRFISNSEAGFPLADLLHCSLWQA